MAERALIHGRIAKIVDASAFSRFEIFRARNLAVATVEDAVHVKEKSADQDARVTSMQHEHSR